MNFMIHTVVQTELKYNMKKKEGRNEQAKV